MTISSVSNASSFVNRSASAIENEIIRVGDVVADTVTTGVNAAVNVVAGTAVVGVKVLGALIDTWV